MIMDYEQIRHEAKEEEYCGSGYDPDDVVSIYCPDCDENFLVIAGEIECPDCGHKAVECK